MLPKGKLQKQNKTQKTLETVVAFETEESTDGESGKGEEAQAQARLH